MLSTYYTYILYIFRKMTRILNKVRIFETKNKRLNTNLEKYTSVLFGRS